MRTVGFKLNTELTSHRLPRLMLLAALLIVGVGCDIDSVSAQQDSPEIVVDGRIHTYEEILRLASESDLQYEVRIVTADSIPLDTTPQSIVSPGVYLDLKGELTKFMLPDSSADRMARAGEFYQWKAYLLSATHYKKLLADYSYVHYLMTLIGGAYLLAGEYDSSIVYLEHSVDSNFIDFQAHWYLASAYLHTGRPELGLFHLHQAHLLTPNHNLIKTSLSDMRQEMGLPTLGRTFVPRYEIKLKDKVIYVTCDSEWEQYALVKALWLAEPGYRERMIPDTTSWLESLLLAEREAVLCYLMDERYAELMVKVTVDGFFVQFLIYEFFAHENPKLMLYLGPEMINSVAQYLKVRHEYIALIKEPSAVSE